MSDAFPPPDYNTRPVSEPPPPPPKQARRDKLIGPSSGSPAALLDPPPECFERPPAQGLSYTPFEVIDVYALKKNLTGGFGSDLPPNPSPSYPHPFETHDIAPEDWELFTKNVQQAGDLTTVEKVRAHVVGPAIGVAFFPGERAVLTSQSAVRIRPLTPVCALTHATLASHFDLEGH